MGLASAYKRIEPLLKIFLLDTTAKRFLANKTGERVTRLGEKSVTIRQQVS